MFSSMALQGIETKTKGVYTRDELKPLAQINVNSLKEFGYFTFARRAPRTEVQRPGRLLSRVQGCGAGAAFHVAAEDAHQGRRARARHLRLQLLVDFSLPKKEPISWAARPRTARWRFSAPPTRATAKARRAEVRER